MTRKPFAVGATVVHKDNPQGAKGRIVSALPDSVSVQFTDSARPIWLKKAWLIEVAPPPPERACLDNPMDPEGGRIVVVASYLRHARLTDEERLEITRMLAAGQPYLAPNGAFSLTPIT